MADAGQGEASNTTSRDLRRERRQKRRQAAFDVDRDAEDGDGFGARLEFPGGPAADDDPNPDQGDCTTTRGSMPRSNTSGALTAISGTESASDFRSVVGGGGAAAGAVRFAVEGPERASVATRDRCRLRRLLGGVGNGDHPNPANDSGSPLIDLLLDACGMLRDGADPLAGDSHALLAPHTPLVLIAAETLDLVATVVGEADAAAVDGLAGRAGQPPAPEPWRVLINDTRLGMLFALDHVSLLVGAVFAPGDGEGGLFADPVELVDYSGEAERLRLARLVTGAASRLLPLLQPQALAALRATLANAGAALYVAATASSTRQDRAGLAATSSAYIPARRGATMAAADDGGALGARKRLSKRLLGVVVSWVEEFGSDRLSRDVLTRWVSVARAPDQASVVPVLAKRTLRHRAGRASAMHTILSVGSGEAGGGRNAPREIRPLSTRDYSLLLRRVVDAVAQAQAPTAPGDIGWVAGCEAYFGALVEAVVASGESLDFAAIVGDMEADVEAWERNPLDTVAFAEALGRADYNLCGGRPLTAARVYAAVWARIDWRQHAESDVRALASSALASFLVAGRTVVHGCAGDRLFGGPAPLVRPPWDSEGPSPVRRDLTAARTAAIGAVVGGGDEAARPDMASVQETWSCSVVAAVHRLLDEAVALLRLPMDGTVEFCLILLGSGASGALAPFSDLEYAALVRTAADAAAEAAADTGARPGGSASSSHHRGFPSTPPVVVSSGSSSSLLGARETGGGGSTVGAPSDRAYVTALCRVLHILVAGLGETPSLDGDRPATVGFRVDRYNTPIDSPLERLLGTPALVSSAIRASDDVDVILLSSIAEAGCLYHTRHGRRLWDDFVDERRRRLAAPTASGGGTTMPTSTGAGLRLLTEAISAKFAPPSLDMSCVVFDAKMQLYRLPALLLTALCLIFHVEVRAGTAPTFVSFSERLRALQAKSMVSVVIARGIRDALLTATEMRFRAQAAANTETDLVAVHIHGSATVDEFAGRAALHLSHRLRRRLDRTLFLSVRPVHATAASFHALLSAALDTRLAADPSMRSRHQAAGLGGAFVEVTAGGAMVGGGGGSGGGSAVIPFTDHSFFFEGFIGATLCDVSERSLLIEAVEVVRGAVVSLVAAFANPAYWNDYYLPDLYQEMFTWADREPHLAQDLALVFPDTPVDELCRRELQRVRRWAEALPPRNDFYPQYDEIRRALRVLAEEYEFLSREAAAPATPDTEPPSVSFVGAISGHRLLNSDYAAGLFGRGRGPGGASRLVDSTTFGRSSVNASIAGLHIKERPELPGNEFAVGLLAYLMTSSQACAPATEVLKAKHSKDAPLLVGASVTVDGRNLADVLHDRSPDEMAALEQWQASPHYSMMVLLALLVNPEDGKPDNYVLTTAAADGLGGDGSGGAQVVCVDNDHAFVAAMSKKRIFLFNRAKPFVKTVLFCFNAMWQPVHAEARRIFLAVNAGATVRYWLEGMRRYNQRVRALFNVGEREGFYDHGHGQLLEFFIAPNAVRDIISKICALQDLFRTADDSLSHYDLLSFVYPRLAPCYHKLLVRNTNALARFDAITEGLFEVVQRERVTGASAMMITMSMTAQTRKPSSLADFADYTPEVVLDLLDHILADETEWEARLRAATYDLIPREFLTDEGIAARFGLDLRGASATTSARRRTRGSASGASASDAGGGGDGGRPGRGSDAGTEGSSTAGGAIGSAPVATSGLVRDRVAAFNALDFLPKQAELLSRVDFRHIRGDHHSTILQDVAGRPFKKLVLRHCRGFNRDYVVGLLLEPASEQLMYMDLTGSVIESLSSFTERTPFLKKLCLDDVTSLTAIDVSALRSLAMLSCERATRVATLTLPDSVEELFVSGCLSLEAISAVGLVRLRFGGCRALRSLSLVSMIAVPFSDEMCASLYAGVDDATALTSLEVPHTVGEETLCRMYCLLRDREERTGVALEHFSAQVIPETLATLRQSRKLKFQNARLPLIPPQVLDLPRLTALLLSSNAIRSVPPMVSRLVALARLSLAHNLITRLPAELASLDNLVTISLDGNPLVDNLARVYASSDIVATKQLYGMGSNESIYLERDARPLLAVLGDPLAAPTVASSDYPDGSAGTDGPYEEGNTGVAPTVVGGQGGD